MFSRRVEESVDEVWRGSFAISSLKEKIVLEHSWNHFRDESLKQDSKSVCILRISKYISQLIGNILWIITIKICTFTIGKTCESLLSICFDGEPVGSAPVEVLGFGIIARAAKWHNVANVVRVASLDPDMSAETGRLGTHSFRAPRSEFWLANCFLKKV